MDTGAQCNVMPQQMYAQVCDKPLQSPRTKLVSFGGQCLLACCKATVLYLHKYKCYSVDFEVIDETVPNILGLHTCTEMNLIQRIDAIENYTDLLESYSDILKDWGKLLILFTILM